MIQQTTDSRQETKQQTVDSRHGSWSEVLRSVLTTYHVYDEVLNIVRNSMSFFLGDYSISPSQIQIQRIYRLKNYDFNFCDCNGSYSPANLPSIVIRPTIIIGLFLIAN